MSQTRVMAWARWVLAAVGVVAIAWFVWRSDPQSIVASLARLGWAAPLVLAPYAVVYAFDTLGWLMAFHPGAIRGVSWARLYVVRWCGEAVNQVVPSGYVGGEAVKALILRRDGAPELEATSSVVVGKTLQSLAQAGFIALGSWCALAYLPAESGARTGMMAAMAGSAVVVGGLFWVQSRGLFGSAGSILGRIPGLSASWLGWEAQARRLDGLISGYYREYRGRFAASAGLFFGGWVFDCVELLLVADLMGVEMDLRMALAIESFIGVSKAIGFFVPGALGVQETGVVLLFRLFGLPEPEAMSYALIRRGREMVFAMAGWCLLYREGFSFSRLRLAGGKG